MTAPDLIPPPRLLLASRSPRRQQLLRDAGFGFTVVPANVDESEYPRRLTPSEVPLHLARAKARRVAEEFPHDLVLAADTLIVFSERIVAQPSDAEHARRIIQLLSSGTHIVITGVSVQQASRDFAAEARVMSAVKMKNLTPQEIERHITSGQWQGKAGGYGLQDGTPIIERVTGCRTNVIGLPMTTARRLLKSAGIEAREPRENEETG